MNFIILLSFHTPQNFFSLSFSLCQSASFPPFAVTISNTEEASTCRGMSRGFPKGENRPLPQNSQRRGESWPNLQTTVNGEIKLLEPASPSFDVAGHGRHLPGPQEQQNTSFTNSPARERCCRRDGNVRAPRGSTWYVWWRVVVVRLLGSSLGRIDSGKAFHRLQLYSDGSLNDVWLFDYCLVRRAKWLVCVSRVGKHVRYTHTAAQHSRGRGIEFELNCYNFGSMAVCHQKFEVPSGEVEGREDWVFRVIAFNLRCGFFFGSWLPLKLRKV